VAFTANVATSALLPLLQSIDTLHYHGLLAKSVAERREHVSVLGNRMAKVPSRSDNHRSRNFADCGQSVKQRAVKEPVVRSFLCTVEIRHMGSFTRSSYSKEPTRSCEALSLQRLIAHVHGRGSVINVAATAEAARIAKPALRVAKIRWRGSLTPKNTASTRRPDHAKLSTHEPSMISDRNTRGGCAIRAKCSQTAIPNPPDAFHLL
jgi:hypothetical protein